MIITPKIKKRKEKSSSITIEKSTLARWCYFLAVVSLLTWVFVVSVNGASGEAENAPSLQPEPQNEQSATPEPKTSQIAVQGQPEPVEVRGDVDKEEIKALIISEAEEAGYQAPLFAIRVAQCESSLNPTAKGDGGNSYGLWQIHLPSHPDITKEQALDPQWSTDWAMKQMAAGRASIWTCARLLS